MCQPTYLNQQVLDALKFVSETYHRSHERRVGHELQVVIASLTFFAASAALTLLDSFKTSSLPVFKPCVLFAFFAVCLLATWYLWKSAGSNKLDLEKTRSADKHILNYLQQSPCPNIKECLQADGVDKPGPSRWRWLVEIATVWVGALLAGILIVKTG